MHISTILSSLLKHGEPTTVDGVDSAPEKLEIHLKFKLRSDY